MSKIVYIIFSLSYFLLSCGQDTEPKSKASKLNFDSLLTRTDIELGHSFDAASQLFSSTTFRYLYSDPMPYLQELKSAIGLTSNSYNKKLICIYVIQNIDDKEYINFTKSCIELFKKQSIDERLLIMVVFPAGFKTDMRLASMYRKSQVRLVFKSLLKLDNISKDFKDRITYASSGKMYLENKKIKKLGFEE